MGERTFRLEHVLPAVRALVVQELVERLGHNRAEAARLLNITPAAVSQYMEGKRGGRLVDRIRRSKRLMLTVSNLADVTSDRGRKGLAVDFTALIDASYSIMIVLMGERAPPQSGQEVPPQVDEGKRRRWITILRKRLSAEQVAAQRTMGLALWTSNDLVKGLFRQIASDSLRHAEIVSSLMTYLQTGGRPSHIETPDAKELEQIIRSEEEADDSAINELREIPDPAVQLLLASVEADERKHLELLRGLLKNKGSI